MQYEDIDYAIVNDEILASQNRAIENILDTSVIDRTQVILDIFSLRAQSKSGQLQVELAQLEYLVPRLKGQGINLSRLDRKSTRLNSSHVSISYAVFCL